MPSTVTNPTSEPSDSTPPSRDRAEDAADQGERKRQEDQRREAERAEVGVDHQQDAHQRQRRPGPAGAAATPRRRRIRRGTRGGTRGGIELPDLRPRSRGRRSPGRAPATLQVTSIRRDAPSRLISFGAGTIATSATSPSGTCVPSGDSIGRLLKLSRRRCERSRRPRRRRRRSSAPCKARRPSSL